MSSTLLLFGIVVIVIGIIIFASFIARLFQKVPPNKVMVISGGGRKPTFVKGGARIVIPFLQRVDFLPLNAMMIELTTSELLTKDNVRVRIDAVAMVKVDSSSDETLLAAAERFLGKSEDEFASMIREVLEGHTREIVASTSMDQLLHEREEIAKKVQETSIEDLAKMGLRLDTYNIKDIHENQGYIESENRKIIAEKRTEAVKKEQEKEAEQAAYIAEARKKKAQAQAEAEAAEAEAQKKARIARAQAQAEAEAAEAEAQRNARIARAQAEAQAEAAEAEAQKNARIARAQAEAEAKQQEAEAERRAQIAKLEAEMAVAEERKKVEAKKAEADMEYSITQKQRQIELEQLEIQRKERELEANVKKPAEAEKHKIETLAEAEKAKQIAIAQAQAEKIRLQGLAEAEIEKARGLAEAEAEKARGLAEAEVIEAQGLAQAKAMMNKAQAWKMYNQAAIIELIVDKFPELAKNMAEPLTKIDKIVMVSGDGAGPSKLTKDVASTLATLPEVVKQLTGVNLTELITKLPSTESSTRHVPPKKG